MNYVLHGYRFPRDSIAVLLGGNLFGRDSLFNDRETRRPFSIFNEADFFNSRPATPPQTQTSYGDTHSSRVTTSDSSSDLVPDGNDNDGTYVEVSASHGDPRQNATAEQSAGTVIIRVRIYSLVFYPFIVHSMQNL